MTWTQYVALWLLIFGVGWVVEARLEALIKQVDSLRDELHKEIRGILLEMPD